MPGATISRWTMSYFATALLFLLVGEMLAAIGVGYPAAAIGAPDTLVVVHIFAIGWLSLLFCGALLQFVPVLVAKPLRWGFLALPSLVSIIGGLLGLIAGFLGLSGRLEVTPLLLPVSALLLAMGFGALVAVFAMTLFSSRPLGLPARIVATGLVALGLTVLLGTVFANGLSGASESPFLINLLVSGVPSHAALGLGGWMTLTAIGVSYRLLTMFMLSPEEEKPTSRAVLWIAASALALVALLLAGIGLDIALPVYLPASAIALSLAAIALYGHDILHLYRARKRKVVELNIRVSLAAICCLGLGSLLLVAFMAFGAPDNALAAAIHLLAFGWLTTLGLGQLYKIIPFLTWLECYGPILGRRPVPRVQDLVNEHRAGYWFLLHLASAMIGSMSLLLEMGAVFQASAAGQLLAIGGLVFEFIQARRLSCADVSVRLPEGASRPKLIFPSLVTRS